MRNIYVKTGQRRPRPLIVFYVDAGVLRLFSLPLSSVITPPPLSKHQDVPATKELPSDTDTSLTYGYPKVFRLEGKALYNTEEAI